MSKHAVRPTPSRTPYPYTADTPIARANFLAGRCSIAKLDDWQAGWIAGHMSATAADELPPRQWIESADLLIAAMSGGTIFLGAAANPPLADAQAVLQ